MIALEGTVKNGQVVLDEPNGLPEGTRVRVMPAEASRPTVGVREEEWPTTPTGMGHDDGPMTEEEIKTVLAAMKRIEPLVMTTEEEDRWRADLKAQRDYDEAAFEERGEKSRRIWE